MHSPGCWNVPGGGIRWGLQLYACKRNSSIVEALTLYEYKEGLISAHHAKVSCDRNGHGAGHLAVHDRDSVTAATTSNQTITAREQPVDRMQAGVLHCAGCIMGSQVDTWMNTGLVDPQKLSSKATLMIATASLIRRRGGARCRYC
eukprot:2221764-Prymnesium_polylepis.1